MALMRDSTTVLYVRIPTELMEELRAIAVEAGASITESAIGVMYRGLDWPMPSIADAIERRRAR